MRLPFIALLAIAPFWTSGAFAAEDLQKQFDSNVKPFVGKYCVACPSGPQPPAQFDLKPYPWVDQEKEASPRWSLRADRLTAHEMPPKQMPKPPQALVDQIIAFVH